MTSPGNMSLLIVFSITFGFFSSGYSAIQGGVLNQREDEAAERIEAIDSGMVYGLLNVVRGIEYLNGGLAGVLLLKAGSLSSVRSLVMERLGALIIFMGLSSMIGGRALLWKWKKLLHLV